MEKENNAAPSANEILLKEVGYEGQNLTDILKNKKLTEELVKVLGEVFIAIYDLIAPPNYLLLTRSHQPSIFNLKFSKRSKNSRPSS